ncbi:MAG: arsenate reductase ArsC [Pseudomonadota bacterium]
MNILILCTGNSARSILGEALVNSHADKGLRGYSAGSTPKGAPHPMALEVLSERKHDTSHFASKSWDVFAGEDAPSMDIIITVCDNAAGEACPYWPGHPVQAHWGLPDPAAIDDPEAQRQAFETTYSDLKSRVDALATLPFDELDANALRTAVQAIHDRAIDA